MTTHPYIGSSLDDFLEEDGILEEVEAIALERVLACLVQELMQESGQCPHSLNIDVGAKHPDD